MRYSQLICIFFLFNLTCIIQINTSAITYQFEGAGRFGDCIMIYCKSRYLAYKYKLPFLYKPFYDSDKMNMHLHEKRYNENTKRSFKQEKLIKSGDEIDNNSNDILFITDLFTALEGKNPSNLLLYTNPNPLWSFFWIDQIYEKMHTDREFGFLLKNMLQPICKTNLKLPESIVSVAVHIRKGSGYDRYLSSIQIYNVNDYINSSPVTDTNSFDYAFPLKFPPDQYYIDQIKLLSSMLNDKPIYVEIFTDDKNPYQLVQRIQANCGKKNIKFCLGRYANLVDELYYMSQFDCLIRSCSHFPGVAQLMGNHKIIIRPQNYTWHGPALIITDTVMIFSNSNSNEMECVTIRLSSDEDLRAKASKVLHT